MGKSSRDAAKAILPLIFHGLTEETIEAYRYKICCVVKDYSEELSRQQYNENLLKQHNRYNESLKRQRETLVKNQAARRASYEFRYARWLAMGIPDYVAELQVSYERHIEVRRMRDVAGMTLVAIGTRLSLSPERVRQIYLSEKHKKNPPIVKWLRDGEAFDLARLAGMPLPNDSATYKSLQTCQSGQKTKRIQSFR